MKKIFTQPIFITSLIISLLVINSCKKDSVHTNTPPPDNVDWATPLVGVYTQSSSYQPTTTVTVKRQSNKVLSISVNRPDFTDTYNHYHVSGVSYCFDSVKLISADTSTINQLNNCGAYQQISGSGIFSKDSTLTLNLYTPNYDFYKAKRQ